MNNKYENNQPFPIGLLGNYYAIHNTQYEKMQNKPNLPNTLRRKNEKQTQFPFHQVYKCAKNHANGANFTPNFSSETHKKRALFLNNCKKMHAFCKLLILTHLTQCTTKTYIISYPKIPLTRGIYQRSLKRKKSKTNPISPPTSKRCPDPPQADPSTHLLIYPFTHL